MTKALKNALPYVLTLILVGIMTFVAEILGEVEIIFPEIRPAVFTGFGLAFGRCLGEYGSVVFIAGNKPYETEITPLIIMSELQEFDYKSATAIALVMLAVSFLLLFVINLIQARNTKILKGG